MSKQKSFGVWVLEMLLEAVGTAVLLFILTVLPNQFVRGGLPAPSGFNFEFLCAAIMGALFAFFLTAYMLTTALAAMILPRSKKLLYPAVCTGLYLVHSEMFLRTVPRDVASVLDMAVQMGGAALTFAVTMRGDRLRGYRYLKAT